MCLRLNMPDTCQLESDLLGQCDRNPSHIFCYFHSWWGTVINFLANREAQWSQKLFLACQRSAGHLEPLSDIFSIDDWQISVVILVFLVDILCVLNPAGRQGLSSLSDISRDLWDMSGMSSIFRHYWMQIIIKFQGRCFYPIWWLLDKISFEWTMHIK